MAKKQPASVTAPAASSPSQRVFTHTQLLAFLESGEGGKHVHHDPRLPKLSETKLVELVLASGQVVRHEFDTLFRCGPRYTWGDASVYEVLRSLRPKGYLSHHSAAHAHGLTLGAPKVMY